MREDREGAGTWAWWLAGALPGCASILLLAAPSTWTLALLFAAWPAGVAAACSVRQERSAGARDHGAQVAESGSAAIVVLELLAYCGALTWACAMAHLGDARGPAWGEWDWLPASSA